MTRRLSLWVGTAWWLGMLVLLPQPACARQDQDPRAQRERIEALVRTGQYEEAERAARQAIAGGDGAELENTLGEVLELQGELQEAGQAYRRAVAAGASDSLTARLNLATLAWNRGERADATREFNRFIDIYNRSVRLSADQLIAVGTAVRYLGAGDPQLFKDALKAYDEAIAQEPENVRAHLEIGELFFDKYNSPDAQAAFAEVIEIDPQHPRALLGLAKAKGFEGAAESLDLARRALEINPNLVPARIFLARQFLDLEEYEAATGEAERALDVNPASLEALSTLAAIRYLQGDRAGWEQARQRVLTLNPAYSELFTAAAELAGRHRRYAEAAEFASQAVALNPQDWKAWSTNGLNRLRVGEVDAARESLEKSFGGDPYNVWTKNTLDLLDTFDRYETRSTEHIDWFLRGDEAGLLFPYASELGEEAYAALTERYGYRPEGRIRVEVYPSHADFSVRTVGLAGLGALGVSFGNVLAMDSPSARDPGDFNWGSTFWHELAHAITLGLSEQQVPRWLTEGLSVLEERRARPGWGDDVSTAFLQAYQQGELLPASELNNGFVRPRSPQALGHAYYQASLVAEMIEQEHGWDAVLRMLRGYGEGQSTAQLFGSVLSTTPKEFDQQFDGYLRERFASELVNLPRFQAALAAGRRDFAAGQLEAAQSQFERARDLFPGYAAADGPLWHLAAIHEQRGEVREAAEALARLTAINEKHYAANIKLAELLEAAGDSAGAAAALERAIYISPAELGLHTQLAALYKGLGEAAGEIRERQVIVALEPTDRAGALYQLALAYLQAGDAAAARREVLRALEEAPGFEAAQQLLLRLSEGAGATGARE